MRLVEVRTFMSLMVYGLWGRNDFGAEALQRAPQKAIMSLIC